MTPTETQGMNAENARIQEVQSQREFEQRSRHKALDVANSYSRPSQGPLQTKIGSLTSLLADAETIYNWLIKK